MSNTPTEVIDHLIRGLEDAKRLKDAFVATFGEERYHEVLNLCTSKFSQVVTEAVGNVLRVQSLGTMGVLSALSTGVSRSHDAYSAFRPGRTIVITNETTGDILDNDEVQKTIAAVQKQIDTQFGPVWGVRATLVFQESKPSHFQEHIKLLNTTDEADALGYHTTEWKTPVGYTFVQTDMDAGEHWSSTFDHEVLEQLVDPYINQVVRIRKWLESPAVLTKEVCDPVERGEYQIDGVWLSNFVTPAWYREVPANDHTTYDQMNQLKAPLTLTEGGYQSYSRDGGHTWKNFFARTAPDMSNRYSRKARIFA